MTAIYFHTGDANQLVVLVLALAAVAVLMPDVVNWPNPTESVRRLLRGAMVAVGLVMTVFVASIMISCPQWLPNCCDWVWCWLYSCCW